MKPKMIAVNKRKTHHVGCGFGEKMPWQKPVWPEVQRKPQTSLALQVTRYVWTFYKVELKCKESHKPKGSLNPLHSGSKCGDPTARFLEVPWPLFSCLHLCYCKKQLSH
jgi:hypothetical protein